MRIVYLLNANRVSLKCESFVPMTQDYSSLNVIYGKFGNKYIHPTVSQGYSVFDIFSQAFIFYD